MPRPARTQPVTISTARTPRNQIKKAERTFWWGEPIESDPGNSKVHEKVCDAAKWLDRETGWRNDRRAEWRRYYEGIDTSGLSATERMYLGAFGEDQPLTVNAVAAVADAFVAKVAKQRPRPLVMTMGGDYKMRKRGQGMVKVLAGEFYENDAYEQGPEAALDMAQLGDGFLQVYMRHGRVAYERVLSDHLLVDDYEAERGYRFVRQKFKLVNVHKEVLKAKHPRASDIIQGAEVLRTSATDHYSQSELSDMCTVVEAWHLPSGPDAKDGRHVMAVSTGTLGYVPYAWPEFPFARFSLNKQSKGYWAQGVVTAIEGLQLELYRLLAKVSEHYGVGAAKWLVHQNTQLNDADWDDGAHKGIAWEGPERPFYIAPPPIHPAYMQQAEWIFGMMFDRIGLSRTTAHGEIPRGLQASGEALRTYYDVETDRWSLTSQGYERAFVQLAKLTFRAIEDWTAKGHKYAVVSVGDRDLELVDWANVHLDRDNYRVQIFNTNFLPATPAGKIAAIGELLDRGLLDPQYALQLLSYSDLEAATRLALAPLEDAQRIVERVLEEAHYEEPNDLSDLKLLAKIGHSQALRAREDGYSEEGIAALEQLVGRALQKVQATQVQVPSAIGGGPGPLSQSMGAPPQSAPGGALSPAMGAPSPSPVMPAL